MKFSSYRVARNGWALMREMDLPVPPLDKTRILVAQSDYQPKRIAGRGLKDSKDGKVCDSIIFETCLLACNRSSVSYTFLINMTGIQKVDHMIR
jgi:hypothetical protein